jgi:hypothetical protein
MTLDHGLHELGVSSEVPATPRLAGVLFHLVKAHSYGIDSWLLPSVGAKGQSCLEQVDPSAKVKLIT